MQTTKFRIYDKKRKEWVHDTEHAISLLGEVIIMGEILRRPDDTVVTLEELEDLEVMQFTGLLDKNGKEIYEGDIVRCYTKSGEVALYVHEVKLPDFYRQIWSFNEYQLPADLGQKTVVELISNIYENPELLK